QLGDDSLLRGGVFPQRAVVAFLHLACAEVGHLPRGADDDNTVALVPTFEWIRQNDSGFAGASRLAEFDPGAFHRRTVKIHAPAATNDGRASFLVHALGIGQSNQRFTPSGNWLVGRADFQCGPRLTGFGRLDVSITVEAVFTGVVAGLDFDQAHI